LRPVIYSKPIAAWNSDRERQEFYKSRGEAPDAVEPIEEERNLL